MPETALAVVDHVPEKKKSSNALSEAALGPKSHEKQ